MGKVRIKQVGSGFEEIKKPKKKTVKKTESDVKKKRPALKEAPSELVKAKTPKKKSKPAASALPTSSAEGRRPKLEEGRRIHPREQYGRSARYKKATQSVASHAVGSDALELQKAIRLTKKTATAKFPESIEAHINVLKTDLRITVSLPYSTGKKRSILILTADPKALKSVAFKEFESDALNIQIGGPEKVAEIKKSGSLPRRQAGAPEVDEIWATSDIMKEIASVAPILGPAGLMPNPKRETVVQPDKLAKKIKTLASGQAVLETERKAPVIHAVLGKASMDEKKLLANLEAILAALGPKSIKKVTLTSTMGPGIKASLPN